MAITKKLVTDVAKGITPRQELVSEIINSVPILDMAQAYADTLLTDYRENVTVRLRHDQYEAIVEGLQNLLSHFELIEVPDNDELPRKPGRPKKKKD